MDEQKSLLRNWSISYSRMPTHGELNSRRGPPLSLQSLMSTGPITCFSSSASIDRGYLRELPCLPPQVQGQRAPGRPILSHKLTNPCFCELTMFSALRGWRSHIFLIGHVECYSSLYLIGCFFSSLPSLDEPVGPVRERWTSLTCDLLCVASL